jgi:DNA repair exonuclease SbcCD ATPase subunit
MGKSGQKLEQNKPEDSLDDQEKAIEDLKAAQDNLKELEEEARRRLMELPFEKMEKDQLSTKQKTDKLAEDMEDAETGGKNNIQQAVPKQKKRRRLAQGDEAGQAKQDQQDAVDQLEEAQRRLEDALAQLRQELQEEVLKALEERFTEMLARQRQITAQTILTEKKRKEIEKAHAGRADPDLGPRTLRQAGRWRALARRRSGFGPALIEEEGSTAVFPEIVKDLADDLRLAGRMLERYETGPGTVEVQKSVEQMLEDLLDALTRRMEEQQGGT